MPDAQPDHQPEPVAETVAQHSALWIDGRLVPAAEATVSPFDHGITVGDGIFETLQVVRGQAFAATRHLARLRRSATGLRLPVPLDDDALRAAMHAVIEANHVDAGRLRLEGKEYLVADGDVMHFRFNT